MSISTKMALADSFSAEDVRLLFRNYRMRANTRYNSFIGKNSCPQPTSRYSYRKVYASDHENDFATDTDQEEPPEWIGKAMAKDQSYQEQKVFARRQCVRFASSDGSSDEYGIEDEVEDNDENEEKEQDTEAKREFSRLAKVVSAMEQHTFKSLGSRCYGPRAYRRY